jgi:hypothetical protein
MLTYPEALALIGLMLAANLGIIALSVRALRRQARENRVAQIRRVLGVR